jgi:hypothetical protein
MNVLRSVFANKWYWLALAFILAFLVYHAPRLALSIPFI